MERIAIVDDHSLIREGLVQLIAQSDEYELISSHSTGIEFLSNLDSLKPDLLIVDVGLPDIDGLTLVKKLRKEGALFPILMYSMHSESVYGQKAFEAGANGYVCKQQDSSELLKAIKLVINGAFYVSGQTSPSFNKLLQKPDENPLGKLSKREKEVFIQLSKGQSLKEISWNLKLSESTVSTYRKRVFDKLDFESIVDLIRFSLKNEIQI